MVSFSIAMGTYNGAKYLREQLESLLNQDLLPVELVVGDDGSTDDTLTILKEFSVSAPFPVRVTRNPKQLGYGENFLQAANRCNGDWIAFCDQDDVWLPSKLARCAEAIESGPPDLGMVVHGAIVGNGDLTEITRTSWPKAGLYKPLSLPPDWLVQGFRQVIRRPFIREIPFDDRRISWMGEPEAHDAWACLVSCVAGSVAVLDECLVIYRRHEANTTEVVGLAPKTLLERIRGKIRGNSSKYRDVANVYYTISNYLQDRAATRVMPEYGDRFRSASTQIAVLGDQLITRAQINPGNGLATRVRAYATLARSGAYWSSHRWGVGTAEATLDLIRVMLPRL